MAIIFLIHVTNFALEECEFPLIILVKNETKIFV